MRTHLNNDFLQTADGETANKILRSCVHCGFCNATCPTYQLLGDELDGPRGRIYLIKQALEGTTPSRQTQLHLDRCLTCRNCESTCPSGVRYNQLLDIGRAYVNRTVSRSLRQRVLHFGLRKLFLNRRLFTLLLKTGQSFRPLMPATLKASIPEPQEKIAVNTGRHPRKVLLVTGCVQPVLKPHIDDAARIVFDRLDIECIEPPTRRCCGSLSHHLNAEDEAMAIIKANIDEWWPLIKDGDIEAICMTASGCGVAIKEYSNLLAGDSAYAEKASVISGLYRDPIEIISAGNHADRQAAIERLSAEQPAASDKKRIVFHPPCTLQHGLQLKNLIEPVLENCGYTLLPIKDKHLCCGSAGTYSITQKKLSQQLLSNKLSNLEENAPELIITANIGCQLHLQSGTSIPVKHWLELFI